MYLLDPVARARLCDVPVQTYFAPEIQSQVAGQGLVNLAAFAYAKDVIADFKVGMEKFAAADAGAAEGSGPEIFEKHRTTLRSSLCIVHIVRGGMN